MPEVMGLGTETVSGSTEFKLHACLLSYYFVGKILATSISLNFGFWGVFSPAILVGAAAGALVSTLLVTLGIFEDYQQALIISGIAAVAGAVIGAPICMVLLC